MYVGDCILGDFGSALRHGKHSREHTLTHWPTQIENPLLNLYETCVAIDFFQLAVTLLERAGHLDLSDDSSTARCRDAIARLHKT